MSSLSGKQRRAEASAGEKELLALGNQQIEAGRNVARPALLRLREDARVSSSDRNNALGMTKATVAAAASDAAKSARTGLRAGKGVKSSAYRMAIEEAVGKTGKAQADAQAETSGNMDKIDLQAQEMLSKAATGQMTEAMTGLRAGVASQAAADLSRVSNENMQRERQANENTAVLMAGLKGVSYLGGKFGTKYDDVTGKFDFTEDGWGSLAKLGFMDDNAVVSHLYDRMAGDDKNPALSGLRALSSRGRLDALGGQLAYERKRGRAE